jgi:hypothetical protein
LGSQGKRKGKEKRGSQRREDTYTGRGQRRRAAAGDRGDDRVVLRGERERKKGKSGHRRLPGEEPGRRSKMYLQQYI